MKALINSLTTRSEEITGTLSGSLFGYIAHRTFADVLVTLTIATATGFLGAAGAYLFKLVKEKIFKCKR